VKHMVQEGVYGNQCKKYTTETNYSICLNLMQPQEECTFSFQKVKLKKILFISCTKFIAHL
jgi:hypothetical protein